MSERMVRKQVYIRPDQDELLKRRSEESGLTESELIRRGIDLVSGVQGSRDLRAEAWKEIEALVRERLEMHAPQTERTWTREELYEERLGRRAD